MPDGPSRLYGVLDCAIDPALYAHVERLGTARAACLFLGRIQDPVRRVSPHLVELAPDDPLTRSWQGQGWGQAWGLVLSSRESLQVILRRLRHFTQAKLPSGEGPVLFRFWDPRVFRTYLPLVAADEIGAWFTGIDRYIAESEDGQGSIHYTLAGGGVAIQAGPRP